MTVVAEAEALIAEHMPPLPSVLLPLSECTGAVLRQEVLAERDQPPFDRVTMDGVAIAHRDWQAGLRRFEVIGTQAAGMAALALSRAGQCAQVMTGAVLPQGSDTVIPVERIRIADGQCELQPGVEPTPRQYVHGRGSDGRAGDILLQPGTPIGPAEMAVLASAGLAQVRVSRLPSIAVISTGDELVDVDEEVAPYQIRSSNDRAVETSLVQHRLGRVSRARLKDDPRTLLESIERLHAQNDVLILSGGVSMGQYDFVPAVLEKLGVRMVFHRIEQRPGRPMWFGTSEAGKAVFALPGNPVSTLVCLTRYVEPALRRAMGLEPPVDEWVRLAAPVERSATLTYFMPVSVHWSQDAVELAEPRPTNTSGDFVSLVGTDGFVELPPGNAPFPSGGIARLFRW